MQLAHVHPIMKEIPYNHYSNIIINWNLLYIIAFFPFKERTKTLNYLLIEN